MPKRRGRVTYNPSDSRYDKPFKWLGRHGAYLVTLQDYAPDTMGLYDVAVGDRAIPNGVVVRPTSQRFYNAHHYTPGHSADIDHAAFIGTYNTLDKAIEAILHA